MLHLATMKKRLCLANLLRLCTKSGGVRLATEVEYDRRAISVIQVWKARRLWVAC